MNWFSARRGACLSEYNAAARAACTSAKNQYNTVKLVLNWKIYSERVQNNPGKKE